MCFRYYETHYVSFFDFGFWIDPFIKFYYLYCTLFFAYGIVFTIMRNKRVDIFTPLALLYEMAMLVLVFVLIGSLVCVWQRNFGHMLVFICNVRR